MLTYKQVEGALARLHNVSDAAMGAFRGRIKHFQRIGIVTRSPGKGAKIDYQIYDLLFWGYALELSQFGIDPTIIKEIIANHMPSFIDAFEYVDRNDQNVIILFHPNIMSAYFNKDTHSKEDGIEAAVSAHHIINGSDNIDKIRENLSPKVKFGAEKSPYEVMGRRAIMLNVSLFKRQLEAALDETPGVPKGLLRNVTFERVASID